MGVFGILEVDLTPSIDDFGYFTGRDAAALVPPVPPGVAVEIKLGAGMPLNGLLGPLLAELRPAGAVVVRGTRPDAVTAVYEALRVAFQAVG